MITITDLADIVMLYTEYDGQGAGRIYTPQALVFLIHVMQPDCPVSKLNEVSKLCVTSCLSLMHN